MKKTRQVGIAIIWNREHSQVLIDQRLPQGDFGSYWEFPGGKIEPHESVTACIKREIKEELGIDLEVDDHLLTLKYEYEHLHLTLIAHHAHMTNPDQPVQAIACQQVKWVKPSNLINYQFPAANYKIIDTLVQNT